MAKLPYPPAPELGWYSDDQMVRHSLKTCCNIGKYKPLLNRTVSISKTSDMTVL